MSSFKPGRREFLHILSGSAGATWLAANWPAMVCAAERAHQATKSGNPALEALTVEQAREVDALTSRIIPTDDVAGAHEAGVVYFIDQALKTFASDALPLYQTGLAEVQEHTSQLFPGVARFSAATPEQQDQTIASLFAESEKNGSSPWLDPTHGHRSFVEILRVHAICGYLVDPEGGGNRDFAGWKAIGRNSAHVFSPPFGYYDKDYPGWQPAPAETEKK